MYMEATNVEVVEPSPVSILFGTGIAHRKLISHNIIYLISKYYIFRCAKKSTRPNFNGLQLYLDSFYVEQEYLARIKNRMSLKTGN